MKTKSIIAMLAAACLTGTAGAQTEVFVSEDITQSTVWTADNRYNLQDQIYVLPGATLTIEAGTVIASTPTENGAGSLAVTNGAQIFVLGTPSNPVIFTSTADVATWTNGDPRTGTWRPAANEWGNLTIMGDAFIGAGVLKGNAQDTPSASNVDTMEGLTEGFPGDTRVLYGGGNDDYDAGTIRYASFRYAGRVIGLANELNGLSLGGLGRGTDIEFVEIMNNVDDGIEIWGGTVNLKNFSIWNIGDDSLDFDQGWRGKAQFGLIVQGYSLDASQGSGVGDNAIEGDGAEDSDVQPRSRVAAYNMTVLGEPIQGDGGVAYRDGMGIQIRNSIFMDLGERLVRADGDDGDGSSGYGHNGTLSFADTWTTPYTTLPAVNTGSGAGAPAVLYTAQSQGDSSIGQGFVNEITDSVFFRNLASDAYENSDTFGVTVSGGSNPAKGNVVIPGDDDADAPIVALTRTVENLPNRGSDVARVTLLDPRPANEAVSSISQAPNDGFFTPAAYRGAFSPTNNWLKGWSAADAFGFLADDPAVIYTADFFSDAEGWTFDTSEPELNAASGMYMENRGLLLQAPGCSDCFGFWSSPDISVTPGERLQIEAWVYSDAAQAEALGFRIRLNEEGFRNALVNVVESTLEGELSPEPGEARRYVMEYDVPADADLIVLSLDLLSFDATNDLNSTVALDRVVVRSFGTGM